MMTTWSQPGWRAPRIGVALALGLTAGAMTISGTFLNWGERVTPIGVAIGGGFGIVTLLLVLFPFVLYSTRVRTPLGSAVGAVALAGCLAWAGLSSWSVARGESPLALLGLWVTAMLELCAVGIGLFTDWLVMKQTASPP